ncbi:MAG: hypothetical protein AAF468_10580 [Pseudomonadota bacterium]
MGPSRTAAILLSALVLMPTGTLANECLQKHALYGDADGQFELRFREAAEPTAVTSNEFDLVATASGVKMNGIVMWNQGFSRPQGILMLNCPEGDVTGAELEACTLWQGIVYALKPGADADLLPADDKPAAPALLLADIGRALHYSDLRTKGQIKHAPWDVFQFKSCQK